MTRADETIPRPWWAVVLVSMTIVAILCLQTSAALEKSAFWPFMNYAMYRRSHSAEEKVARYSLVGTLQDGSEVAISPEDLGLSFFKYRLGPVEAMLREDREVLLTYADIYDRRHPGRLVSVKLMNCPVSLDPTESPDPSSQLVREMAVGTSPEPE